MLLAILVTATAPCEPVEVTKTVTRKVVIVPGRGVAKSEVYVTIVLEGEGVCTVDDRTFVLNPQGVRVHGESGQALVEGNFVRVVWHDVKVEGKKVLSYVVDSGWAPLDISVSVLVNDSDAEVTCGDSFCVVEAGIGSELEYRVTISNCLALGAPIAVIVSATIDPDYLTLLETRPKPDLVRVVGEYWMVTWMLIVEEESSVALHLRVKSLDAWGEVPVPSVVIVSSLDPEPALSNLVSVEKALEKQLESILATRKQVDEAVSSLGDFEEFLNESLSKLKEFSEKLEAAANASFAAASALRNASELAYAAASDLETAASSINALSATVAKIKRRVDTARELVEEVESIGNETLNLYNVLENLPVNVSSELIEEATGEAHEMREKLLAILSQLARLEQDAEEGARKLRELGAALEDSANKTETLGRLLLEARDQLVETTELLEEKERELSVKREEYSKWVSQLEEATGKLRANLTEIRTKKALLESLRDVREKEMPLVTCGGQTVRGVLVSDEVHARVLTLKAKPSSNKPAWAPPSGKQSEQPVMRLGFTLGGLVCLLGSACVALRFRKRNVEGDYALLEEIDRLIKEVEKASRHHNIT